MAKRRQKKRTHVVAKNPNQKSAPANASAHASVHDPKSMVIRIGAGEVGSSVSQLATDVRRVMEPGTASRLKERRGNRLRDYLTMCGPLGVSHLLLFSRSNTGNTNLRIALAPRGPTLHFRIERYSLCKDVRKAQRHPKGGGREYINPPLLVMNNFRSEAESKSKVPKHLESLATTVFQSLFPSINPQQVSLKSIRRVLLLNREISSTDDSSFILNFRHYAITTKVTGISKPLRRLNTAEKLVNGKKTTKGGLPNLGRLQDISDYMIGGEGGEGYMTDGGTSGSEAETDAEIEVRDQTASRVLSRKARAAGGAAVEGTGDGLQEDIAKDAVPDNVERRAVRLVELGPRMRLRLIKVEEGLCQGQVMWHEHVHKSKEEIQALKNKWEQRTKEKEARKKQQRENIEKKRKAEAESGKGAKGGDEDDEDEDEMDLDNMDTDDYDAFDSDGLAGDAELQVNKRLEVAGEWEDEEAEIATR